MKRKISFLFLVITCMFSQAQNNITGVLRSADNPVDYANVVLLAQADSTFLTGTVSGEDGSFSLVVPTQAATSYLIRVTCIGYKPLCRSVQVGNLGVIEIESDTQMLNEIVVKGDLPVTRLKGDAMVTNIDGSVLAKTGTAQNMLDYIPGVASQKGELQVLGRGKPVVYINGRLIRNMSELDQLSSEDIQQVEVVSNPGARYDASVKAVIRIRTKKAVGDGLGVNARLYTNYNRRWDFLNQFNLNYRKGGLDIFGMLYLYKGHGWNEFTLAQNTYLEKNWKQVFNARDRSNYQNMISDFGLNYALNENHSIGFKYRYDRLPSGNHFGVYDVAVTEDGVPYEDTHSISRTGGQTTEHSLNLYYNGNVKEWNIDLNADMLWMDDHENQYVDERIMPKAEPAVEQTVTTFNQVKNNLYASKLIFSHSLWGGEIALGGEFSYTNRHTDYRNPEGFLQSDDSKIKESNLSSFVEFSRQFGAFQLQAGVRYEHVDFDYYQKGVLRNEQSKKYDNLFPSLTLATSLGKMQFQLSYAQDISRPSFNSLRSNVHYANHYTYETGNPFLRPSIVHNINLAGSYKWWQISASYQRQKDNESTTTVPYSEENPNIVLFKPINLQSYDVAYIQLNATPTIGFWSPRFTLSAKKQWLEMESPEGWVHLDRPQFYFRWQNSLKLPAGFLFNVNGSWMSKYESLNNSCDRASWRIDLGLHKSFWNDKLTFQVNGYDVFLTQRYSVKTYEGKNYTTHKELVPNTRNVSFTVRYRFNQAKNKYKGTGAGESQKSRL